MEIVSVRKKTLIILLLLILLPACALGEGVEPIRIGVFEPLTGNKAAGGLSEYHGIQIAHALVPTALGRPVELIVVDNQSSEPKAVNAAIQLCDEEDVSVVLGSWGSSLSIAGAPYFEASEIPAIGISCTSPAVTAGNAYYFRICFTDDFQGTLLASYAKHTLNAKRAAIICDISNVYAIGLRKYFIESFGAENIVAESYFTANTTDFCAQIVNVMAMEPEVILVPADYIEPALIMRQASELGYHDVLFLGGDTWEVEDFIEVGGEAVEACRFTSFFDAQADPSPESESFLAYYQAMVGGVPESAFPALGFDAYMAAIMAIEAAGSDEGPAIRDALSTLSFHGATGAIAFDENGDAIKTQAVIKTVRNGTLQYLDTVYIEE